MAEDAGSGKDVARRFGFGPRTLASLLPPIVRPAFRSRAPAAAQLMSDWAALAGPELAAMASPRRFAGGTLTLAASGPDAMALQHRSAQIIERLNLGLGRQGVERLRVVQEHVAPALPELPPRRAEPAPVEVPDMPDGPLRDALARLGGHVARRPGR